MLRLAASLCLILTLVIAVRADPVLGRYVVFAGASAGDDLPGHEGASVSIRDDVLAMEILGDTAWSRVWFRGIPQDIRPLRTLHLRVCGSGAPTVVYARFRDAKDNVASGRVGALGPDWEDRALELGSFRVDAGFDPVSVVSLSLTWFEPRPQRVRVARIELEPGEPGWRLPDKELARRVFGKRRMNAVKHVATDHFDLWSDSGSARRAMPDQLERAFANTAAWLGVSKDVASAYRLPVYSFKSAQDFRTYCIGTLGWSKEQATQSSAAGTYWSIVMRQQGKDTEEIDRRVAKSVFQHALGVGGGAWLLEGVGEAVARSGQGKSVTVEAASRIKSGDIWPLASLVSAAKLYKTGTDATFDYRPVYQQAGSFVEYLREAPDVFQGLGELEDRTDRARVGLERLAAIRASGEERVRAVEAVLGSDLETIEDDWKTWVAARRKR